MTPAEQELLHSIGTDVLRTFVAIVFHTFTYTIYLVVAVKATHVSLRIGHKKASMVTLILVILMFLMATVLFALDIVNFITETVDTLIHAGFGPLDIQLATARSKIFNHLVATDLIYSYMCILGDAVIIWRVKVLWGHTAMKWILFIPCSFLVGSMVASILLTYCGAHLGAEIVDGSFQKPLFCKGVQTASYSMGFATTTVATTLIAIKAWQFRRTLKPMVNSTGRMSRVEKVMLLLVESGVIYLLFFLVQVIGNIPGVEAKNASSFVFLVYSYSTSVIVGLYPTIVVVLAHSQRAMLDTAVATHTTTWRAAQGPSETTTTGFWSSSREERTTTTATADNININLTPFIKQEGYRSNKADEMI